MAVPFLTNIQKKLEERQYDKKYHVRDKRILVIGGGDTAMDCVRSSIREKAANVKCVYRRDEENMPRQYLRTAKSGIQLPHSARRQDLLSWKRSGARSSLREIS